MQRWWPTKGALGLAGLAGTVGLCALFGTASCRTPTQWTVIVRSEVSCGVGAKVLLYTAPTLAELDQTSAPAATADTCGDGVDDLVIVPRSGGSDTFFVRLATRVDGKNPTECITDAKPKAACIVQMWQLTFRPHEAQILETKLSSACVDVVCPSGTTCVRNGECVPSVVGECPNGCSYSEFQDTGVRPDSDADVEIDVPPPLKGPAEVVTGNTTCVRYYDGRVWCWGANGSGQAGWGDRAARGDTSSTTPDKLSVTGLDFGSAKVVRIATAEDRTCAVLEGGKLRCWGSGLNGLLGYGDTDDRGVDAKTVPGKLADLAFAVASSTNLGVKDLAMGGSHTCALLEDDTVRCWGQNGSGQLGYGDDVARPDSSKVTPVPLGPTKVVRLAAGLAHTCALFGDGTLKCWGKNAFGELGLGDHDDRGGTSATTPDKLPFVFGPADVHPTDVVAGGHSTCVILRTGEAKCWGQDNFSRLGYGVPPKTRGGDASSIPRLLPVIIWSDPIKMTASAFALGLDHTCVRFEDGRMRCWGANESGQLGNKAFPDLSGISGPFGPLPYDIPLVTPPLSAKAVSIAAAGADTCAILDDRSLKCWGSNAKGQLGLGDTDDRKWPADAIALPK